MEALANECATMADSLGFASSELAGRITEGSAARQNRAKFLSLEDLEAAPPIQWQIDGLVEKGSLVAIYGPPRSYKSFLAMTMALSVANGTTFAGREVRQGAALMVAGEGSLAGLRNRWKAYNQVHQGDVRAPFRILPASVPLTESAAFDELLRCIVEAEDAMSRPCDLIVLDTLSRTFGAGDENNHQHMRNYLNAVTKLANDTGATVMIVAHSGKDYSRGIRGASVIEGWVDGIFFAERQEGAAGFVTLKTEKMKDSDETGPLSFELRKVELDDGATSLSPIPAPPPQVDGQVNAAVLTPIRRSVLDLIQSAGPDGIVSREAAARAAEIGIGQSTYYDVIKFLISRKLVQLRQGRLCTAE